MGDNYIKFANGLLIQWGVSNHGKYATVTSDILLQIPFKDIEYRVQVTPSRNCQSCTGYWIGNAGGNNTKTAKNFQLTAKYNDSRYDKDWEWIAIGRWK